MSTDTNIPDRDRQWVDDSLKRMATEPLHIAGRQWWIDAHDSFVGSRGHDGARVDESREAVVTLWVAAIRSGLLFPEPTS